jgi:hypothetical protein
MPRTRALDVVVSEVRGQTAIRNFIDFPVSFAELEFWATPGLATCDARGALDFAPPEGGD